MSANERFEWGVQYTTGAIEICCDEQDARELHDLMCGVGVIDPVVVVRTVTEWKAP